MLHEFYFVPWRNDLLEITCRFRIHKSLNLSLTDVKDYWRECRNKISITLKVQKIRQKSHTRRGAVSRPQPRALGTCWADGSPGASD